jgi:RHS repeat-associated protein
MLTASQRESLATHGIELGPDGRVLGASGSTAESPATAASNVAVRGGVPGSAAVASGSHITFSELSSGTIVYNQYSPQGVEFSGPDVGAPVFVADDSADPGTPALSGSPLYEGPIYGVFVKPGTSMPVAVDNFSINVGYIDDPGSTQVVAYSTHGIQVLPADYSGYGTITTTIGDVYSFVVEEVAFESAGFTADDLMFRPSNTPVPGLAGGALSASESFGRQNAAEQLCVCSEGWQGDPVNTANGNYSETYTDVSVPGDGPTLRVDRTYNSLGRNVSGVFGAGWSSLYDMNVAIAPETGDATVTQSSGATVTYVPTPAGFRAPSRVTATLTLGGDGTYTFVTADHVTYTFTASGQLASVADRNGLKLTITRPSGSSIVATDASGRKLMMSLSGGHVISATDPLGRITRYTYSGGDLTAATSPGGAVTAFGYAAHELVTVKDPLGHVFTNHYDALGRVDRQTDAVGRSTAFDYDSIAEATRVTDVHGGVTIDRYVDGLMTSTTVGFGSAIPATTSYVYDPVTGGAEQITDPDGRVTKNTYDIGGHLLTTTDPLGNTTTNSYDALGDLVQSVSPLGELSSSTYDAVGNLVARTDADGDTVTIKYDDATHPGDPTQIVDPDGRVRTLTYDAHGDVASVSTSPAAGVVDTWRYTYDADSERVCTVAPVAVAAGVACSANVASHLAGTTTWTYDKDGRVLTGVDPLGHTTTNTYDLAGNRTRVVDGSGNSTVTMFDADNRSVTVTEGAGPSAATTRTSYDVAPGSAGCPVTVTQTAFCTLTTDAAGGVTSEVYDVRGQLVATIRPGGKTTTHGYDAAGNQTSVVRPGGTRTTFYYDAAERPVKKSYSDGTRSVTYTYDADGRRLSASNAVTTKWSYDPAGRITTSTSSVSGTVSYRYDRAGNEVGLTYPDGSSVERTVDGAGRITAVTDWLGHTTTFTYDANDSLIGQIAPDGTTRADVLDANDLPISITIAKGATTLARFSYVNNPDGLTSSVTTSGISGAPASQAIGYDTRNRVTSAGTAAFNYDTNDNLTVNAGNAQRYSVDGSLCWATPVSAAGACDSPPAGATTYTSDGDGNRSITNLASGARTGYRYDAEDRLTTVNDLGAKRVGGSMPLSGSDDLWLIAMFTAGAIGLGFLATRVQPRPVVARVAALGAVALVGGAVGGCVPTAPVRPALARYTYSADGLRVTSKVGSVTAVAAWTLDGLGVPEQLTEGQTRFVYGPSGLPIEQVSGEAATFLLGDRGGSTRLLVDESGTVTGTYSYDAWGKVTSHTGSATTPFQFDGQHTDSETGFQYLRARYYDPSVGEFISVDPALALSGSAYGFADANPFGEIDPLGLWGWNPLQDVGQAWHDTLGQHWRGATQVGIAVVGGVAATACIAATAGICGGAIGTIAVVGGIGITAGDASYAVGGGDHTLKGYVINGAVGGITSLVTGGCDVALAICEGVGRYATHFVIGGVSEVIADQLTGEPADPCDPGSGLLDALKTFIHGGLLNSIPTGGKEK